MFKTLKKLLTRGSMTPAQCVASSPKSCRQCRWFADVSGPTCYSPKVLGGSNVGIPTMYARLETVLCGPKAQFFQDAAR